MPRTRRDPKPKPPQHPLPPGIYYDGDKSRFRVRLQCNKQTIWLSYTKTLAEAKRDLREGEAIRKILLDGRSVETRFGTAYPPAPSLEDV